MSDNGKSESGHHVVDPVGDLDELLRLIRFLGKCKSVGFSATLGWIAERLQTIREAVVELEPGRGRAQGEMALHEGDTRTFPVLASMVVLHAGGDGPTHVTSSE